MSMHVHACLVPAPGSRGAAESTEVLEIVAGGGQKEGVASGSDDAEVDYLQGEDSEIASAFSGSLGLFYSISRDVYC